MDEPSPFQVSATINGDVPQQSSSFIGRERELAEAKSALAANGLLTLTGPGGCGKTRLALQMATELSGAYARGVFWVDLAPVTDHSAVLPKVAIALGIAETSAEAIARTLALYLANRHSLIVLDNCEHVARACGDLVAILREADPGIQILVTSREPLVVRGEAVWLVPPLSMPEPIKESPLNAHILSELNRFDAVRLFVERGAAIRPGFALTMENAAGIVHVCRRLDGLPLAIELASARVKVLTVAQIAERMDSRFDLLTGGNRTALVPRHQTLRAAIDWSFQLLSEPERILMRRLSVFVGSFTIEAVETVCTGDGLAREEILDRMTDLIDKSLVVVIELREGHAARYRLLETIREYAHEKLEAQGEGNALGGRHALHYCQIAKKPSSELGGPHDARWLDRLALEHDNLLASLTWSLNEGNAERGLELAAAMWRYWWYRGPMSEGSHWLALALERNPNATSLMRAEALRGAGMIVCSQGDYLSARTLLEQSTGMARDLDDKPGITFSLYGLGIVAYCRGEYASAARLLDECLTLWREQGNQWGIGYVLNALGELARVQGSYAVAAARFEESLQICRKLKDDQGTALRLSNLSFMMLRQGNMEKAAPLFVESLDLALASGDMAQSALAVAGFAYLANSQREGTKAARLLGAGQGWLAEMGQTLQPSDRTDFEWIVETVRRALGIEAFERARAEGRAMTFTQVMNEARISEAGSPPVNATAKTPELFVQALGTMKVSRSGRLLTSAVWTYAKAEELFFYLMCHSTRTKEQIGLALWPDSSPEQLRNRLGIALYRLRRALGRPDWIVFEHDEYYFDRSIPYQFDLEMFDTHLTEAKRLEKTAPIKAIEQLTEASKLYRGEFLENLTEGDWFRILREQLRRKYLEALLSLGRMQFAAANYSQAAEVYRQVIAHDNLLEAAHRELMRCYAQMGERGQMQRQYQSLETLLRQELGASPAAETRALFDRLREVSE